MAPAFSSSGRHRSRTPTSRNRQGGLRGRHESHDHNGGATKQIARVLGHNKEPVGTPTSRKNQAATNTLVAPPRLLQHGVALQYPGPGGGVLRWESSGIGSRSQNGQPEEAASLRHMGDPYPPCDPLRTKKLVALSAWRSSSSTSHHLSSGGHKAQQDPKENEADLHIYKAEHQARGQHIHGPGQSEATLRLVYGLGILGPRENMTTKEAHALIRCFDEPLSYTDMAAIARLTKMDVEALKMAASMSGPDGAAMEAPDLP
ncbi:hypothetical protein ZWY2020_055168 [Hordeum vulgare]|nr:hypothetical protein ZWY2020_055168 [Hordeum vulgare]